LTGPVDEHCRERLPGVKRAGVKAAHVAHDEVGPAAIPDLKDATLRTQAKLQSLNFHKLRIRPSPSARPGSLASYRIGH
jgi:hypothetical protein